MTAVMGRSSLFKGSGGNFRILWIGAACHSCTALQRSLM
jgi:hypothetical protein